MKITKLGHCCLLIENENIRILTDPGSFTIDSIKLIDGINYVLITHEHADHIHIESLKEILKNNPEVQILTNKSVGNILEQNGILYEIFEDDKDLDGIKLQTFDAPHANVYPSIPNVENTALILDDRFLYPGDSWFYPEKEIEILALPVGGPWLKMSDAINYAVKINPKKAFPVHDGMFANPSMFHKLVENLLVQNGIEFESLEDGEAHEF